MGQKLQEDRIGTLSHSTGVVTLTTSRVTIGGQQYTSGSLQNTLGTLAANTLYMLYVVLSGGVLTLVKSTNVNSVGPVGFTSWKLVGALYANADATPIFGSFVNIEGVPCTNTNISEVGGQISSAIVGFTGQALTDYHWSRVGRRLFVNWRSNSNSGTGSTAKMPFPLGLTGVETSVEIGTYAGQNGSSNAGGGIHTGFGDGFAYFGFGNLSGAAISTASGTTVVGPGAPTTLTGSFEVHITQWSSTPLKDL